MFTIDFELRYGLGEMQQLEAPFSWYLKSFSLVLLYYQNKIQILLAHIPGFYESIWFSFSTDWFV